MYFLNMEGSPCRRHGVISPSQFIIYRSVLSFVPLCFSNVPEEESLIVREILVTGLGYNSKRPFLIALVDQDLLVYEAFKFKASVEGNLGLRFRKVRLTGCHGVFTLE